MAFLEAHPEVGIVGGAYLLVDERRGERYVRIPPTEHDAIIPAMARYVPIAHTMATFRRRAWREAGGYPLVTNLIDLRFYLRVAARGWRFANVPDVLGEHYVHDSSWFHRSHRYVERQRDLASVQAQAVRELGPAAVDVRVRRGPLRLRLRAGCAQTHGHVAAWPARGRRTYEDLLPLDQHGDGWRRQPALVGRPGAARPGPRRAHRVAHAARSHGSAGPGAGHPDGVARDAARLPGPRGLWRLARMVRDWRPDVMHSHMVHANLMARALRLVAPVPALVSTIHNIYEGGAMRMAAYRLTNRLVDHMTIVSQAAADRFVRDRIVPRSLLTIVPNGVDTEQIRQVPPGTREALRHEIGVDQAFVWLAVGRFEPAKDYPNMLRAFARVRGTRPDAVLLLVSRGSLQPETEGPEPRAGFGRERPVPWCARRRPQGDECRGRLRHVLRVGRDADGAARGRGRRPAHRGHGRGWQPRGRPRRAHGLHRPPRRRRAAGRRDAAPERATRRRSARVWRSGTGAR